MLKSLYVPELQEGCSVLEAALEYIEAGWYVLPVVGKKPAGFLGQNWQQESSREEKVVREWFKDSRLGIALHVGRAGAVCFDIDRPSEVPQQLSNLLKSNPSPFQSTRRAEPARGHYLYAQPMHRRNLDGSGMIGNGRGELGNGWGEVRGRNGIIVVEPTTHTNADGHYKWVRVSSLPVLPDAIANLLPNASESISMASREQVVNFMQLNGNSDPKLLNHIASRMQESIESGAGRHTVAVEFVCWMVREVKAGLYPASVAVATLRRVFMSAVDPVTSPKDINRPSTSEWDNIVAYAVSNTKDETGIIRARLTIPTTIKVHSVGKYSVGRYSTGRYSV